MRNLQYTNFPKYSENIAMMQATSVLSIVVINKSRKIFHFDLFTQPQNTTYPRHENVIRD